MTIGTTESSRPTKRPASVAIAKERLRLWLRLLRSSRGMEAELRERLRVTFGVTLPQFDVLAALERHKSGVTMTELSRYLMVSNGNVTGIVDRLVEDGLIARSAAAGDRRATRVALTAKGGQAFAVMAAEHERWVDELLGGYNKAELAVLIGLLDGLVVTFRAPQAKAASAKGGKRR
jgi:DNA-binding MarR family transcriptional regulator